MFETDAQLAELDALFTAHMTTANPHMRRIVKPDRTLNARQVVRYLTGTKHVAFATVTSKGGRAYRRSMGSSSTAFSR